MGMSKETLPPEADTVFARPETAPEPRGMSLDEAISEFIRIEARKAELKQEMSDVLATLLPEAFECRGAANVARLGSHDGKKVVKVEFKEAHKCNVNLLNTAREMIGDDQFEKLFKTEYAPRLREMKMFLASKSADERIETAKQIIREGVQTVQRSPYVTIEKGSDG